MEKIITNPGLQHLAEKIFWNLDIENLKICGLINQSCLHMLDNPMLWLRKFVGLSKANQKDWIKIIQSEKNPEKKGQIIAYLQWNLKKFVKDNGIARKNPTNKLVYEDDKMDLPCYSNPDVQDDFKKQIMKICQKMNTSDEDTEIVKILAPLTDNLNVPDEDEYKSTRTPIHWATENGLTEIVKILAPLADNCNAPNKYGNTPIHSAARHGYTDIFKTLAPLTENPNTPNKCGETPIHYAALNGHTEVVKILAPLTDNPNAPDKDGETPIHWAASNGHTEIVKILAPLTDNPNAPNEWGHTSSTWQKFMGILKLRKFSQKFSTMLQNNTKH